MPSLTQTSIENVTFGRMATLLKYVGTATMNDLIQSELLALLEDFESSDQDVEVFAKLASRLEAVGWQPSQVKEIVDLLKRAYCDEMQIFHFFCNSILSFNDYIYGSTGAEQRIQGP